MEEALDIRQPTEDELVRAWCFCDTSFFLESKRLFRDVSWGTEVGLNKPVVLMIPPAIMDELDDCRFNERRPRQQKRARAVVRAMDELTVGRAHGEPATVNTKGVELIRLGWEPRAAALGLTNTLADDRLVSSALECCRQARAVGAANGRRLSARDGRHQLGRGAGCATASGNVQVRAHLRGNA